MSGIHKLDDLLAQMEPELSQQAYVFATFPGVSYGDLPSLLPVASIQEKEGMTLVINLSRAKQAGLPCDVVLRRISLNVHSSLEAVGLTAAISNCLAEQGISANILAGYFHDHIYVPSDQAEQALHLLQGLA